MQITDLRLKNFFLFVLCGSFMFLLTPRYSTANPSAYQRPKTSAEFQVPSPLRGRVDFWIDIFTKYGRSEFVVHHREYPQARFKVVDLTKERATMSDAQYQRHRKAVEQRVKDEVKKAIEHLAAGHAPQTNLQKTIANRMQFLGSGTAKYKYVLDKDLIRTQTGIKEKYREAIVRSGRYLPIIEKIFTEEFNLPVELTRLPFIESSFDYAAYSSVGAAGIWQFMPSTAKSYMKVNNTVDERRDPVEASRAAAKYLRSAYNRLGSWPLAITSYNHGVAGVARRVAQAGTSDIIQLIEKPGEKVFGFASINFYPEFLAALEVYDHYEKFFPGVKVESPIRAKEIAIQRPISAANAARQYGVSMQALQELNYALSKAVWQGRLNIPAGYNLKVPYEKDLHLVYSREAQPELVRSAPSSSTIYGGVTYKVRRGDTLIAIAKKYGVTVSQIRKLNNLNSDFLRVGQNLIIKPRENEPPPAATDNVQAGTSSATQTKGKPYTVKRGDSLWAISIKSGVSIDDIKKANPGKIVGNSLTSGTTIIIPDK